MPSHFTNRSSARDFLIRRALKRIVDGGCPVCVVLKSAVGIVVVLFAFREMFEDLFHPSKSGAISDWLGRAIFRLFRRRRAVLPTAGPLTVLIVIFTWALLLVVGFALIYWAVFPGDFQLKTANRPTQLDGFWWCFYYSLETLTTLGLGDIEPNPNWLRILSGCQTLVGFSMVTASITWIVLLYPALSRARTLARKTHTLLEAEKVTGVPVVSCGMHLLVAGLAEEVIHTGVDLVHFPILFYFYSDDPRASIPHALFPLLELAKRGSEAGRDDLVRFASVALHDALRDLAEKVAERLHLEERRPGAVFRDFMERHG